MAARGFSVIPVTRTRALFVVVSIALGLALLVLGRGLSSGSVVASGGVLSIAGGDGHTCVVLADSGVQCWGRNEDGQLGDGTEDNSHLPVDVCVSGSGPGCAGGERLTGIVHVGAGFSHTCALTDESSVMCWGSNGSGQLGDGTEDQRSVAGYVCATGTGPECSGGEPLTGAVQLDVGSAFACALMEDTGIKCWGSDQVGQLGIGTVDPEAGAPAGGFGGHRTRPVSVCLPPIVAGDGGGVPGGIIIIPLCFPITGYTAVTTGGEHACALTDDTGAQCWGSGFGGRLGTGTEDYFGSPADVCIPLVLLPVVMEMPAGLSCLAVSGYVAIDAGGQFTCALTEEGGMACWGRNHDAVLGDGTKEDRLYPVQVCATGSGAACGGGAPLTGVVEITTGSDYSCAISDDRVARCWGVNFRGVVGDGTTMQRTNPVLVSGLTDDVAILQGGPRATHACAATIDSHLQCWGNNFDGQLAVGPGDNDAHPDPVTIPGFDPKATATPTDTLEPTDTPVGPTNTPTNTPPPGATDTPTPPPGGLIGDVDCNGVVNAIDAAVLLQFIAQLIDDLPCPENADTNDDGSVNSVDVALILQFTAGLIDDLPPP